MRKTKIICTLGPAVDKPEVLERLILAGMNVGRINFSHGNYQDQEERIENFKKVRDKVGKPVDLMLDTKGPEIRIGKFENGEIWLNSNDIFTLKTEEVLGNKEQVSITYKNLYNEVSQGTVILINDGLIKIKVIEIKGTDIICKVIDGGKLTNTKSINIPGMEINLPSPTEKDIEDIKFGIKAGFDCIAASFVRSAQDILNIKKVLQENGGENIKVIAKIENRQGIDNFDEILDISDGIMVARGDLGVEIPMEEVPLVQKRIIKKCNNSGKIVITATQMLESMTSNPRPTRAEVSDVANAIFDVTGAIMLSGESAMGKYPVQCVETMSRIAHSIEKQISYDKRIARRNLDFENMDYKFYLHHSISLTATKLGAKAIFAYTDAGNTPRIISSLLPTCPIIAVTTDEKTYRQLAIVADVIPLLINEKGEPRDIIEKGIEKAIELNLIQKGDVLAIAGGDKILPNSEASMNRTIGGIIKA